jgi:hypothetical protein
MAPGWFPSAGLAASRADKSAEALSIDVPDEVIASCEPPPTCKRMLSSAHAKYASIMLELFFSRLQWMVHGKGDAAARVPPPIMRVWTPPSAWVSLGSGDIVTSEFDLQDHEFRAMGTAARCVVRPSRVRTASQRVAALAVMTFIANETAGGRVVLDSLIRESKDERSEMRVRARAAVVSEKQKQKKGDAAAAAAAPTPLTNGGGESAKARSRAPRRGSIRPPPKCRRLSSSLAPSAEAEVGGTAAVVAAAAAVASAVAAPDMGALQHPENSQPDTTPAGEAAVASYAGVGLCCQPGSCLMPARPTEKNNCRGCRRPYHDTRADRQVGAVLDIPQDQREGFRVCSPKC